MPSSTSNFKRQASAAAFVLPQAVGTRERSWRPSSRIRAANSGTAVARPDCRCCADRHRRHAAPGNFMSFDRLRPNAQRYRGSLGADAPARGTRVCRHHRRFACAGSISILTNCEKGLGKRPVQLAMGGSCAYPVLSRSRERRKFPRHDHLQRSPAVCSSRPADAADGAWRKSASSRSHRSNARPTRQPISRPCRWKNTSHFSNRKS